MAHFTYRNVGDAFRNLVRQISGPFGDLVTIKEDSRNGEVLVVDEPLMITYTMPRERVLFNEIRDANPFFHLYESMWMLAGRDDLEPLLYYIKDFGRYSDDGTHLHGAYGYRWRHAMGFDQLRFVYDELSSNPNSRRAVVQMWDAGIEGCNDCEKVQDGGKDVPCNISLVFQIQRGRLNMTVFNRSNDILWGMLGANAVHFSFLQEYMATWLGTRMGEYTQVSSNAHVYVDQWKGKEYLRHSQSPSAYPCRYPMSFVNECEFRVELNAVVDDMDYPASDPFLREVVCPMLKAHRAHKEGDSLLALDKFMNEVKADDWRRAGKEWIQRRIARKAAKADG